MKKILFIIYLLLTSINLYSNNETITLRVGVIDNVPPISYMEDGKVTGIFSDIILQVAKENGWKIEWVYATFDELYLMALNNELDIMVGLIKTKERTNFFRFNYIPVITSWTQIFTKENNINNILDIEGKTIGLLSSDQNARNFIELAESFKIDYSVIYFKTYKDLTQAILDNKVDAGVFFSLYAITEGILNPTNIIFSPDDSYFAVNIDRGDIYYILEKIDIKLQEWKLNKNSFYYDLYEKYFNTITRNVIIPNWVYIIIISTIGLIILLYFWSYILKKRIEKQNSKLVEQEKKFRNLFHTTIQGVIYYNAKGEIIDMNPAAENIFDLKFDDVKGKKSEDLNQILIYEDGQSVPTEDHTINQTLKTGNKSFNTFGVLKKDKKHYIWINVNTIPEYDETGKLIRIFTTCDNISDLKYTLNKLYDRSYELDNIIKNMNSGFSYNKILYNDSGKFVDYEILQTNAKFHEIVEIENIVGNTFKNLTRNSSEENEYLMDLISQVINSLTPIKEEIYLNKIIKWIDISIYSPKEGYFVTILDDITKRKNAEQILKASEDALRENQKRLSITFESIGDGVITVDTDFKITMMNRIAKDILERDSGYYGKQLDDILNLKNINIHGHSIQELSQQVLLTKEPYFINQAELHLGDTVKIIEDSISPIYDGDNIYGLVIIFRDITDKIKDKDKNKELENQLSQTQKLESIGKFSGGIAHNFNNILTAITGYIDLIETASENDNNFKYHQEIQEIKIATKSAASLTSQLLTVSRRQTTNPNIIDINDVLNNIMSMISSIAGKDITLNINLKSTKKIKADINQIEQIILNFISNSRDAMEDTSVKNIYIETEDIEIDTDNYNGIPKGNYILISFTDTGSGIPDSIINKIFDPFFTTKENGTGFGLSTSYGIIKQNNAYINVYSEINNGTTFKIYWPITLKDKKLKKEYKNNIKNINGTEKILFVENEKTLQNLAKQFLTKLGYNIIIADDGIDALNKFDNTIDIIVSDVIMPNMSGTELYEEVKKIDKDIKIIFTSGYTEDYFINNLSNNKFNFISKPYSLKKLAQEIRIILES